MIDAAIIGGSGVGSYLATLGGRRIAVATRAGLVRGTIIENDGHRILLLPRHGPGHKVPPHAVNYMGMALAVRELGGKVCLATAAVGSLTTTIAVGSLVVADGMIDATGRNLTMFEHGVKHTAVADPFVTSVRSAIQLALDRDSSEYSSGTYLGANGPRFETPQEITMFRGWGADVVGMTASSEAIAFAEVGIPYGLLCIVTNLGCGLSEIPPNDEEVQVMMKERSPVIADILLAASVNWLNHNVTALA
jgi:5'-methylthioadenosine phosphorylase